MKQNAYIAGVGMTRFGKHLDRGLKDLAIEAIEAALADADVPKDRIETAYMGTAAASVITGQVCIPGQAVLRTMGIGKIPVVNVENACATSSTALQQAATLVTAGLYDVALAVGFEKLYHRDKAKTWAVFMGSIDVEDQASVMRFISENATRYGSSTDVASVGQNKSLFMDLYAAWAREYMAASGATARHFAMVSAKNSVHGSLNPRAQFREVLTVDEVLGAPVIADPLTLTMCSPIGDGAAAAVIVSERMVKRLGIKDPVRIDASLLLSGFDFAPGEDNVPTAAGRQIYDEAGIGPEDLSLVELHDATSPAELMYYEYLGLCEKGGGPAFLESGATKLGGRLPVNTSGGLNRKGHPIGATGLAQIFELVEQLRGRAGDRQVEGARVGLAENGGGFIGADAAAMVMTVLSR